MRALRANIFNLSWRTATTSHKLRLMRAPTANPMTPCTPLRLSSRGQVTKLSSCGSGASLNPAMCKIDRTSEGIAEYRQNESSS